MRLCSLPLLFCLLWLSPEPSAPEPAKALAEDADARVTTVEGRQQALTNLIAAAQHLLNAGQRLEAARALNRAGRFQVQLHQLDEAVATYSEALKLIDHALDLPTQIDSLNGLARVYNLTTQCNRAEPLLRKARALSDVNNYPAGNAESLLILSACQNPADHTLAIQTARESLELWRSLNDKHGMARALNAIGDYQLTQNSLAESTETLKAALDIWRELRMGGGEAEALILLGFIEFRKGAWQDSLSFYTHAQQLIDEKAEPYMMGQINAGLADAFIESGLPEIGLEKYRESLEHYRVTKEPDAEMGVEWGIGKTHYLLGNYLEAQAILNTVRAKAESLAQLTYVAHCDDYLGRTYQAIDDHAAALKHFEAALEGFISIKSPMEVARTRALIGDVYRQKGDLKKARANYQTAMASFRAASDQVNESATLYALGSLELKDGNLRAAEQYLRESIEITEEIRRVSTSADLTAAFSARVHERYEKYIDCLMRKHQASSSESFMVQAFETNELGRARALAELLRTTQTNFFPGLEPQLALKEKQLRESLQVNENALITLLTGKYTKEDVQFLEQQRRQLKLEHQMVIDDIRGRYPLYEDIIRPQAWLLKQIQEQVIVDDQTVLLEFSLGANKSYVWAVTRDGIKSFELPPEKAINESVKKVYDLLDHQPSPADEKQLTEVVQELSRMILFPVASELSKRTILIVADGALHYIPFQILPLPWGNEPLVAQHQIINAPSASILGKLQQETAKRQPAKKVLVAFGDPVFASDHDRRKILNSGEEFRSMRLEENGRLRSALGDIGLTGRTFDPAVIQPLFYARRELASLREVAGPEALIAGESLATRERFLSTDLSQYAMLHLATHGFLNPKRPEHSGFILSTVDEQGKPIDGFIGLREIYELRAPVALAVLSACQTGLGKDVRGEGLIGLTRGFMYAGASGVVASLWKVDDEATSELMRHFYSNLLHKRMPPGAALREAQNSIRQKPGWSSPYYWAAFTLQGDYNRVIEAPTGSATAVYWKIIPSLIALIILLTGLGWWFYRRKSHLRTDSYSRLKK